jgi:2-succinyl-5-enolpyruvyl-6-hydroxy-3-cyclohexene-1-carboxylate synthase
MEQFYTSERNVQIVIGLLKAHGIKRIVASPGSTNVTFVGSVQQDPVFDIYACGDERSASYMAVGIALETGEPCVLSCTGATASRNYFSALTEAFYRKIPILAITSTQEPSKIGNLTPQVIDRSAQPNDIVKISVQAQT